MRGRAILSISVGVNILLAVMIYRLAHENALVDSSALSASNFTRASEKTIKTNVVVRRLPIQWRDLESTDFKVYIQNLRAIGCPEPTVRDIIIAEVNDLFQKRQRTEVVTSEQQWWRLEPDMDLVQAAFAQYKKLEAEKESLLAELLGSNWKTPTEQPPMPESRRLDGPILGALPQEKRDAIAAIELQAQNRVEIYMDTLADKQADPVHLARLREQTRLELGTILNPEQLEEYLLRYSSVAGQVRTAMNGLNAGPDEFRKVFRAIEPYQRELELLTGDTPAVLKRKAALEDLQNAALKQALGNEGYTAYAMNQNPMFQAAKSEVEQQGAPPEKVLPVYEINRATQAELERLQKDTTLNEADRKRAIETVQSQQQQSIKQLLGSESR